MLSYLRTLILHALGLGHLPRQVAILEARLDHLDELDTSDTLRTLKMPALGGKR